MKEPTASLRAFYDSEGIAVGAFRCPHKAECLAAAAPRPLHHGAEAHVGSRFGDALRVVIVSLDTGHEPADLDARRRRIEGLGPTGLNPHMRGTSELVLSLLKDQIPGDASPHPYYAMINAAKCSGADESRGMVPSTLYENCLPFALREISILKPDLVVTQGRQAGEVLGDLSPLEPDVLHDAASLMGASGDLAEWLVAVGNEFLGLTRLPSRASALTLRTPHPAARDGRWQRFVRISMGPIGAMVRQLVATTA